MNKAQDILLQAQRLAATAPTWADLSNALFDPLDGLVTAAFPTAAERKAFAQTKEYAEIRKLLTTAMQQTGTVDGATPRKSGRFVVRLPISMHAALEREARAEGVSLNQLVVAKLAMQLKTA
jgi:predicted HicB family RNase H-like nuclease